MILTTNPPIYNMLRGPLGKTQYKPKFSGHDTFPFRYAWLPKLVNYLEDGKAKIIKESENERLQTITDFGVGLNMVKSIKHWSIATKVCDKNFNLTNPIIHNVFINYDLKF